MATVPRNPSDTVDPGCPAVVLPAARPDTDELVKRFGIAAQSLGIEQPAAAELKRLCAEVIAVTEQLFPGEMRARVKNDPEIPDDLYFVFAVRAVGDIDDLVARNDQWHRRVVKIEDARHGLFRLAIDAS